jgi:hypothetical protein
MQKVSPALTHLVPMLFIAALTLQAQENDTLTSAMQKKPYTITASLREEYDDNIFTSNTNKKGSFKTEFQPSILLNYPLNQTLLSFRYTYDGTYFYDRPGNKFDSAHEFVGRVNQSFSSRFNLDARERFRYSQEPQLFDSASTLFRNGNYINNTASLQFNAQWTPKFGTVTTYTNDFFKYEDNNIAFVDNRDVNTVAQDFRFLVLPTLTVVANVTFEDVSYEKILRSYDNFILDGGADWSATPQLTIGGRIGATLTDLGNGGGLSTSPYALLSANWTLGARSLLDASYTHSVSQTDIGTAFAQESDTITLGFKYQVTPRFATHVQGIYSHGNYVSSLLLPGSSGPFTEDVVAAELNGTYKYNEYVSFEAGYNYTIVSSGISSRDYDRNRVYVGVRGTY